MQHQPPDWVARALGLAKCPEESERMVGLKRGTVAVTGPIEAPPRRFSIVMAIPFSLKDNPNATIIRSPNRSFLTEEEPRDLKASEKFRNQKRNTHRKR